MTDDYNSALSKHVLKMMMVSDDCLVEHKIDDDSGEDDGGGEEINIPPPPPEFASKAPTPAPKAPTPPTAPTMPPPTHTLTRDPYGINKHLKVEVIKVLVEPATSRGTDQVWRYSVAGFEKARIWTYRCLTLLFAVPFALLCGIFLAIFACLHVWFVVPFIQLSNTFLPCLQSLCVCAVDVFISPFCTCFALCCSQMVLLLSNKDRYQRRDIETMRM
ncbi:caveolin-2 [Mastacembelus armatus]|uniref:Caveolin n=1 Tax=Mastacembelus armatus TaxID=205130 RepID=A0A3Q3KUM7_9TELE|nr:caveolin-2-like [Mastacembelus armatus]XP_026188845.1 caveolin-2-like [Mastacembelus armatus]XP_026188848.1 caveolin-2-like [Mastacembelus armatus]